MGREEIQEAAIIWRSGSQSGVPLKVGGTTAALGNSIEMQILRACPRPPESEPLGFGQAICVLRRLPALSGAGSNVRKLVKTCPGAWHKHGGELASGVDVELCGRFHLWI